MYEVFEKVANSYDKMNDAMSFGVHRIWKHHFMRRLNPPHGIELLDVAGGSGNYCFGISILYGNSIQLCELLLSIERILKKKS